jgi:hypothetical protein
VDDPGDLVAEGDGALLCDRVDGEGGTDAPVDQMDVGQTHPCRPDLDQNFSRSGGGQGNLLDSERVRVQVKPSGKHGAHDGTSIRQHFQGVFRQWTLSTDKVI